MIILSRLERFLGAGIFEQRIDRLPAIYSIPLRGVRVVVLAVHGFLRHQCTIGPRP